jgi:hypothetical protein
MENTFLKLLYFVIKESMDIVSLAEEELVDKSIIVLKPVFLDEVLSQVGRSSWEHGEWVLWLVKELQEEHLVGSSFRNREKGCGYDAEDLHL